MFIELFDWIINTKSVRGTQKDDNGMWVNTSTKPLYFCPNTRILYLEDNTKYLLNKSTVCKAIELDKKSEKILQSFPVPPS